ncbi:IctB family putative bicarbonate transporter [Altererythrobacter sp. MTPC7]
MALLAFIVLLAVMGGASRPEEWKTLAVKIIASMILIGLGVVKLRGSGFRSRNGAGAPNPALPKFFSLVLALTALYLVPLPPSLWTAMPGREPIVDFFASIGMAGTWRPATVSVALTLNTLTAVIAPFALVLLAMRAGERWRARAIDLFIAIAVLSVFLGVLQVVSGALSLYFFDVANFGRATGVFANRNHHAIFLAASLPLCLYRYMEKRSQQRKNGTLFLIAAGLILAGCLLGSSRAGLAMSGLATLASLAVFAKARPTEGGKRSSLLFPTAAITGVALVALPLLAYNSEAFGRLVASDPIDDLRFKLLPDIFALAGMHFPFGSGPGTFEDAYRMAETDDNLMRQYVNEAHNDWLQPFVEYGVFAFGLILWPIVSIVRAARTCWRGHGELVRVRSQCLVIAIAVLALGSFLDYPLRTAFLLTFGTFLWYQLIAVAMGAKRENDTVRDLNDRRGKAVL